MDAAGNPEFKRILDKLWELHLAKGSDYGKDTDFLSNIRSSEEFGIPGWLGATLRANDKMSRLKTYAKTGKLTNEGVEDSFLDLASYAILALVMFRDKPNP